MRTRIVICCLLYEGKIDAEVDDKRRLIYTSIFVLRALRGHWLDHTVSENANHVL